MQSTEPSTMMNIPSCAWRTLVFGTEQWDSFTTMMVPRRSIYQIWYKDSTGDIQCCWCLLQRTKEWKVERMVRYWPQLYKLSTLLQKKISLRNNTSKKHLGSSTHVPCNNFQSFSYFVSLWVPTQCYHLKVPVAVKHGMGFFLVDPLSITSR